MIIEELKAMVEIDSTSGREDRFAQYIVDQLSLPGGELKKQPVEGEIVNLFYSWGIPEIIFCTHLDTVPPFIAPTIDGDRLYGRGACDAKGQIVAAINVCRELYSEGESNFGLLLLAGEEVGSKGAKVANRLIEGCRFVIVGEPTENKLIKAGKGVELYEIEIAGKSAHSGYPHLGENAIERMGEFLNRLANIKFPHDPLLGETTYNIGELSSPNPYNVISNFLSFKLYFRTTFASHPLVEELLQGIAQPHTTIKVKHKEMPMRFHYIEGFDAGVVAYGCDAPSLTNLGEPLLYGPGSITTAHTNGEYIDINEIKRAVKDLKKIYKTLKSSKDE
ncbi:MAG: M20/M25/M40 family metallo-hydrolase [Bacteroidales bacterium]